MDLSHLQYLINQCEGHVISDGYASHLSESYNKLNCLRSVLNEIASKYYCIWYPAGRKRYPLNALIGL